LGSAASTASVWGARILAGTMAAYGMIPNMLSETPGGTMDEKVKNQEMQQKALRRMLGMDENHQWTLKEFLFGKAAAPNWGGLRGQMGIDNHVSGAKNAGAQIQDALSVTAKPSIDNTDLRETLSLVNAIKAGMSGLGNAAARANAAAEKEMHRNFADYGVSP
jgi:hypothetical protein